MAKGNIPQRLGLGDSYLNLIVGIIVVVAIAAVVIGLIRNRNTQTGTMPGQEEQAQSETQTGLPTKHKVAKGEDLWKISEKYYKTGYNWVDIATENNLDNPNGIEEGMELTIPNVTPKLQEETKMATEPTLTPVAVEPATESAQQVQQPAESTITGNSYTVVLGDYLWSIALRAYGDGFKWVEIAQANKLVNPDLIHPGNVLTLPR